MINAYDPHGASVLDYHQGNEEAVLICYQDGHRDDVPVAFWFRQEIDPLEQKALELCSGRVLDLGAGTGVHALRLQSLGFQVTAIDISAECVTVMRERGVKDARRADYSSFSGETFDTVLSVCNGLDKVGALSKLPGFLARMAHLLRPGGQLLVDSFDLSVGATDAQLALIDRKRAEGRYYGEMDLQFEYDGSRGSPFSTLQVDFSTLRAIAEGCGWSCSSLGSKGAHYLALLKPATTEI